MELLSRGKQTRETILWGWRSGGGGGGGGGIVQSCWYAHVGNVNGLVDNTPQMEVRAPE